MAAIAFGILLVVIVLVVTRRRGPEAGVPSLKPTILGWCTLAFGLIAAAALALAMAQTPGTTGADNNLWSVSVTFTVAAVIVGIWALTRRDRHWPTWAGLVVGLVPAVVWIAFAAGNILGLGE